MHAWQLLNLCRNMARHSWRVKCKWLSLSEASSSSRRYVCLLHFCFPVMSDVHHAHQRTDWISTIKMSRCGHGLYMCTQILSTYVN